MTLFAFLGGLLVLLALVLIVPPILRRNSVSDQEFLLQINDAKADFRALKAEFGSGALNKEEYEQKRSELSLAMLDSVETTEPVEQTAVTGRWAAITTAIFIPVLALGLYFLLGKPNLIDPSTASAPNSGTHQAGADGQSMPPVADMIAGLEKKLEENPENAEGWFMLGRAYMLMKDYPNAVTALQRTRKLVGEDPDILMRLADAMAMRNDGRVSGEPAELIKRALVANPNHGVALWLAGIAAQEVGQTDEAIKHWQQARKSMASAPDSVKMLDEAIEKIQSENADLLGIKTTSATEPVAETAVQIQVEVSLSEALKNIAAPEDSVFIFARAASGPPMPLAVQRALVKNLPATFILDDSQAMMPTMKLSSFKQVIVGARISKSGNPIKQAGDLEGLSQPLTPEAESKVSIVIGLQ